MGKYSPGWQKSLPDPLAVPYPVMILSFTLVLQGATSITSLSPTPQVPTVGTTGRPSIWKVRPRITDLRSAAIFSYLI